MASELCMNCFSVKGNYEVCPYCGYAEGTPPKHPQYLKPGTILANHFIVGTAIDMGGFGITYRCYDTTLGIMVAVKEFFPSGLVTRAPGESKVGLVSADKREQYNKELRRFLMEAQSIAQFGKAKDIVNVYDFFEANNTAYIIMEYIEGVLLKDYLEKQGALKPQLALKLIHLIINSVKKIHSKGIIHRDISPDNIFIASEDSIKVFDFGAAQLNDSQDGKNCEKVIKVGYSAPEQYRDKSNQGYFTDIYSIGAILYQMLTGVKPIESTEREYKDELKSPLQLGIKIEPNIDRAVMEAMAVQPELRFQNIQQLEDALNSKRVAEYPEVKLKKRKRRRGWIIGAAAAVVLALGCGTALYNTVLKTENPVFESKLTKDEIEIWVDSAVEKECLENIVSKNFHAQDKNSSNEGASEWTKENQKIDVKVVDVSADGSSMEQKLIQAQKENKMPDMFLSDHVSDLSQYDLVSYKDTVYKAIEDRMDEYLYMADYEKYYPQMNEMPTGINTLFLYAYKFDDTGSTEMTLKNSVFMEDTKTYGESENIEISTVLDAAKKEEIQIPALTAMKIAILEDSSCFDQSEGTVEPNDGTIENLYQIMTEGQKEKKDANVPSEPGNLVLPQGNAVISDSYFRSILETSGKQKIKENKINAYKMFVITSQNNMLIQYENCFAITDSDSTNKKNACLRFLWTVLGEGGQAQYYANNSCIPINQTVFKEFFDYNPSISSLKNLVLEKKMPCIILGRGEKELETFADGLNHEVGTNVSKEKIKAYCQAWSAKQEKEKE